jgi:hypothetical protein
MFMADRMLAEMRRLLSMSWRCIVDGDEGDGDGFCVDDDDDDDDDDGLVWSKHRRGEEDVKKWRPAAAARLSVKRAEARLGRLLPRPPIISVIIPMGGDAGEPVVCSSRRGIFFTSSLCS